MRIQHNIMAMNAYRNYTNNTSALSKNLEKLSSGYKINRAGDDAAGLAISEKMRAQITGLDAAQKNVKDGISLVKTAEGAMQEVQDMLNRMVYLATQSANGTYDNEVDRANLQKEIDQLNAEIDRIADSANFNGIKLLDGSLERKTASSLTTSVTVTPIKDGQLSESPQAGEFSVDLSNATLTNNTATAAAPSFTIFGKTLTLASIASNATMNANTMASQIVDAWNKLAEADKTFHGSVMNATVSGSKVTFTMANAPTEAWNTAAGTGTFAVVTVGNQAEQVTVTMEKEPIDSTKGRLYAQGSFTLDAATHVADGKTLQIGDTTYVFAVGRDSQYTGLANVIDLTDMEQADVAGNLGLVAMRLSQAAADNANFKVGTTTTTGVITLTEKEGGVDYNKHNLQGATLANKADSNAQWVGLVKTGTVDVAKSTNGLVLQIGDTSENYNQLNVSVQDMHAAALGVAGLDISTQESAQAAINTIKAAINSVSMTRGTLGATQNRLEHTANNLSVMEENIQDAESTIRDTDIAEEMMAYTKNNILVQSAQAMLAQANMVPQGVLQLLG